jgi:hypothetical protein
MLWRCGPDPVAGSCDHYNEPSDSMKVGDFLSYLSDCQLSKVDRALSFFKQNPEYQYNA